MAKKRIQKLIDSKHKRQVEKTVITRHSHDLVDKIKQIAAQESERVGHRVWMTDVIDLALQNMVSEYFQQKKSA